MSYLEVCGLCSVSSDLSWRSEVGSEVDKALLRLVVFFVVLLVLSLFIWPLLTGECLSIASQSVSFLHCIELWRRCFLLSFFFTFFFFFFSVQLAFNPQEFRELLPFFDDLASQSDPDISARVLATISELLSLASAKEGSSFRSGPAMHWQWKKAFEHLSNGRQQEGVRELAVERDIWLAECVLGVCLLVLVLEVD